MVPDVFSTEKRSDVMSRIRGSGNKDTELALIRIFRENHIVGWRRHQPIFGKPDFVFPKLRIAVFVDGCFWHGCSQHATKPKNNADFWERKLSANKARDLLVNRRLRSNGWRVLRIWEHELGAKQVLRLVARIRKWVVQQKVRMSLGEQSDRPDVDSAGIRSSNSSPPRRKRTSAKGHESS